MVVGAARLYDWSGGSRLRSPRASLQRGPSSDSQAPDTLRTRQPPPPALSASLPPWHLWLLYSVCCCAKSFQLAVGCATVCLGACNGSQG